MGVALTVVSMAVGVALAGLERVTHIEKNVVLSWEESDLTWLSNE